MFLGRFRFTPRQFSEAVSGRFAKMADYVRGCSWTSAEALVGALRCGKCCSSTQCLVKAYFRESEAREAQGAKVVPVSHAFIVKCDEFLDSGGKGASKAHSCGSRESFASRRAICNVLLHEDVS
jgi:hypothetical protein